MKQITFATTNGTVKINDVNTSEVNGTACRLNLNDFDGNSLALNATRFECVDVPGQKTISTIPKARTITAKIGFAPLYLQNGEIVCTGETGKDSLRREIMKLFPLGIAGTLTYTDTGVTRTITARVDETPLIKYVAGLWAEATIYLTADYPYWQVNTETSDTVTASANTPGWITSTTWGDVKSPIELYITVTEAITYDPDFYDTLELCIYSDVNGTRNNSALIQFAHEMALGLELKVINGVDGKYLCYAKSGDRWIMAPEYLYYCTEMKNCINGTSATTFRLSVEGATGAVSAYIVFHNLSLSV